LWKQLQNLPFIKIKGTFYPAKEVYSHANELLNLTLKQLVLPDEFEYRKSKWMPFLTELGLRVKCDLADCIQIARILSTTQMDKQDRCVKTENLLVREIEPLLNQSSINAEDKQKFIDSLKFVKFLPIFNFEHGLNRIPKQFVNETTSDSELISLNGSVIDVTQQVVCWLRLPMLPDYCEGALGDWAQRAGAVTHISGVIVAENLCKLIERLETPFESGKGNLTQH
jgi:hypothetical protein